MIFNGCKLFAQCNQTIICCLKMSPVVRKPAFCICEKKTHISCAVTAQLISAFVFAERIIQSLLYLSPKLYASSHLLWLYSLACMRPGQKPRRPVFSQRGSNVSDRLEHCLNVDCENTCTSLYIVGTRVQACRFGVHVYKLEDCESTCTSL